MNQSSSILYTEQFPDALQNLSTEQCRAICTALAETNNASLVNKRGQLGGYTALAWMCINKQTRLQHIWINPFLRFSIFQCTKYIKNYCKVHCTLQWYLTFLMLSSLLFSIEN